MNDHAHTATATDDHCELRVRGMHCAGCVATVEKALRSVPGVAEAAVNLATESATVRLESPAEALADALVEAVRKAGYEAEVVVDPARQLAQRQRERVETLRSMKRRILIALAAGIPAIALQYTHGRIHVATGLPIIGLWLVEGLLTAVVLVAAAGPMISGAIRAVAAGGANMDVLVAIGVLTAFVSSVAGTITGNGALVMYEAAALIVLFVSIGKYFELRARGQASSALEALLARVPQTALRVRDGQIEEIPTSDVQLGDVLQLRPQSTIPVDGRIEEGQIAVDESMLTGESLPVQHGPGDKVLGGTIVVEGSARITATATGATSAVARIASLVEQAQLTRTPWQRLADRVAAVFVPVVLVLAAATFVGWLLTGHDWLTALERMIAVTVVACPCAMGLAVPTAVLVGTTRAAERGILVRDAAALETCGHIAEVLLDKTGTLTLGKPRVEQIVVAAGQLEAAVLRDAAALEQLAQHPLATAIVEAARQRDLDLPEPKDVNVKPGAGMRGVVDGRSVVVGSESWLAEQGVDVSALSHAAEQLAADGHSVVFVAIDGQLAGLLGLMDTLHPEARAAIDALHDLGVRTCILSGDRPAAVQHIARLLGIDDFEAGLRPEDKLERVRQRSRPDHRIAMVGDGINDAPALAAADVGIAIGTGADVAREAADICLVGHNPRLIADAVRISRASARVMKQNLFWAAIYNAVMLPVAMVTMLPPAAAAAAMMFSSFSVVGNSLRLRKVLDDGHAQG